MPTYQVQLSSHSITCLGMADAQLTSIHVDYAGMFLGKMFLVGVDAHSMWPEILITKSTWFKMTIKTLCTLFGQYGVPTKFVNDN